MELLSVVRARALWFVDVYEINPRGINLITTFIPALVLRYGFTKFPDDIASANINNQGGLQFSGGKYLNPDGVDVELSFTIFKDALTAETRSSTKDSESFLEDMLSWATETFNLVYKPRMVWKKGYVSEITVRLEPPLSTFNDRLRQFAARISSLVSTPEETVPYEFSGLLFSPEVLVGLRPSAFQLERVMDVPFSENKYTSQAPLHTDTHLELLNELEQILRAI
jgi:hypothetical protein